MTIMVEAADSFKFIGSAHVFNEDIETASTWASKHMTTNKDYKWIVGKYAESDNANSNRQYFELSGLQLAKPSLQYSPMNIDHHQNENVGTWVAADILYPKDNSPILNPYIEVLGAFWKTKFPETLERVESAFNSGMLALSMEAIGESVTCIGENSCGSTYPFKGPSHPSYCAHINERASDRQLNKPWFRGGALILPPNRPGWNLADVTEVARSASDEENQSVLDDVEKTFPQMESSEWQKVLYGHQLRSFVVEH